MKMVCFATSLFYPSSSPHCPPTSSVTFRLQTVQDPCFPCYLLQPLSRCGENSFALMCIKSHLLLMCMADSFLLFIPQHLRLNLHDSAMTGTRQLLSFNAFICTQFTLAQVKVFTYQKRFTSVIDHCNKCQILHSNHSYALPLFPCLQVLGTLS